MTKKNIYENINLQKRNFYAKEFSQKSFERTKLNRDILSSEYSPNKKYVVTYNTKKTKKTFYPYVSNKTFITKKEAEIFKKELTKL